MNHSSISWQSLGILPRLIEDYLNLKEDISALYSNKPSIVSFKEQIENHDFSLDRRRILYDEIVRQNESIEFQPLQDRNVDNLLQAATFTVCTAHQPILFGGPMYFVFKILSTIKLCEQLSKAYPSNNFVPIYWMGDEDHDFEEVNHCHVFGNKISWKEQSGGPVGRMDTKKISKCLDEIEALIGDSKHSRQLFELLKEAYASGIDFSNATRQLVHNWFGKFGLLVLSGDSLALKKQFSTIMKQELIDRNSIDKVNQTTSFLSEDYKVQAFPREINLFYMLDGLRERIEYNESNEDYEVLNSHLFFSEAAILNEVDNNPDRFSPNVILRPVYQEFSLPNLAYIGGAGELSYWLQLKQVFELYKVKFPILLLRDGAVFIDRNGKKKLDKLNLSWVDLFLSLPEIQKQWVDRTQGDEVDLGNERAKLAELNKLILEKALIVDLGLKSGVSAELNKFFKILDSIEQRMNKAARRKHQTSLEQIESLKNKVFPEGVLQERHEGVLSMIVKNGPELFDQLLLHFNPLDGEFHLFMESD